MTGSAVAIELRASIFLDVLFGLITQARAAGSTDSAADHGTRRSGQGAPGQRAGSTATDRAGAGTGLIVAFGGLTCHGTPDGTDRAADDGARRPPDGHTDAGPAERSSPGPHGLGAMLVVIVGALRPLLERLFDATPFVQQIVLRARAVTQIVLSVHRGASSSLGEPKRYGPRETRHVKPRCASLSLR
jgi:hypothetical protein